MRLEFENNIISNSVYQELNFRVYLDQLEANLAIIPHKILHPMNEGEAKEYYARVAELESQIIKHNISLESLIQHCEKLPAIDYLLPFFEDKQLDAYHLFDLGRFIRESLLLETGEARLPLQDNSNICKNILQTLQEFLANDFGSLKLTATEEELQKTINRISEEINNELTNLEGLILGETGIKMVYPFPKEIDKDSKTISRIKKCKLLKLINKDTFYQMEFNLHKPLISLMKKKELYNQTWQQSMTKKLGLLNAILSDQYDSFVNYYQLRKTRVFDYVLLLGVKNHALCLPRFTSNFGIKLIKGILPVLKSREEDRYKPLDLTLNKGVNVLFGANMTGKTTVLKTLYFLLTLVKFGLPIPAKSFELGFPNQVNLHLRGSGQLDSGLSGFGDEIQFFCDIKDVPSVYLIDELFHSTDPTNGVILTDAFLSGLSNSGSIIFCCSHYHEVLKLSGINFYKMKDIEEFSDQNDLKLLLEKVPYEIEPISKQNLNESQNHSDIPLKIALRFPLPDKIIQNIRKKLEN